jgi:hypothetical protein
MDRIAAKVAQKIGVLFQHDYIYSGARQQKAEHHSGRPSADDAALGLDGFCHTPRGVVRPGVHDRRVSITCRCGSLNFRFPQFRPIFP